MDKLELTTGRLSRDVREGGETLIQVSLQYPQIGGAGFGVLDDCLASTAENLVDALCMGMLREARAAAGLLPEALPYQISGTFTVTYNSEGVLSFFTDVFLYAGGMRGVTYRYGSTFVTAEGGRPIFMTSLFPAQTDVRAVVSGFAAGRLGVDEAVAREGFSPENMYLTEGGLAVFFTPGAMGPVAGGSSVVVMPFGDGGPRVM
ncbi:MAG: DUF4163 domain-containing protein [Oscillospiraceae bacterium]|nr:DUF4163 domain-containing protein [Oscillospiraceae bacterium]